MNRAALITEVFDGPLLHRPAFMPSLPLPMSCDWWVMLHGNWHMALAWFIDENLLAPFLPSS